MKNVNRRYLRYGWLSIHHTVADYPTASDAERHCRLDSFAMVDQASALLRVVTRDGAIEMLIASIKMCRP
jgi:hypothetical protein